MKNATKRQQVDGSNEYVRFGRIPYALAIVTIALVSAGCGQAMLAHDLNALNARFEQRLQLTGHRVPAAVVGQPYSGQLGAAGGVPPYHWKVVQGVLPQGLALEAMSGTLSGVPQGPFEQPIIVELTDSSGDSNCYVRASIDPATPPAGLP